VTGPGTAMTGRPHPDAQETVLRAPLRATASTMTVPWLTAAMRRFRARKRAFVGLAPGGYSDTTAPRSATRSSREAWIRG